MIFLSTIKDAWLSGKKRILQVLGMGANDVREPFECAPFGVDASPLEGMIAVYADTLNKEEAVIVGYINENQVSGPGEIRLYALDQSGDVKTYIHLKNDGSLELLGGTHNLIRHSPLNTSLQDLVAKINTELGKIATGITAAGGSYAPAPVSIDISSAKIQEIKTI